MVMTCSGQLSGQLTCTVFWTLQLLIIRAPTAFDVVRPASYGASVSQGQLPSQSLEAYQLQRHRQRHHALTVYRRARADAITDGSVAQASANLHGQRAHMRHEQRRGLSANGVVFERTQGRINRASPEMVPSLALLGEARKPMTYEETTADGSGSFGGTGSESESDGGAGFQKPKGYDAPQVKHLSNLAEAETEVEKFDKIVTGAEALAGLPDSTKTTPEPEEKVEEKEGGGAMMIAGIVLIVVCGVWSCAWLLFVLSIYARQPAKSGPPGEDAGEAEAT
mmetsp:Transcript_7579/g.13737  ORF Transcript_7579/g.13737 Transcript_7579/m.13737 type:complete len:280 (+) Transcript_7579:53-892(+)